MGGLARRRNIGIFLGIGAATAAAHAGNNFTTFLIGGLMDRYHFSPFQMGSWSMVETLAYAVALLVVAPRAGTWSSRNLLIAATALVVAAQVGSAWTGSYFLLMVGRVGTGFGFALANAAVNLAAARTANPARAISIGIACQTPLYAVFNLVLPQVGTWAGVTGMFIALGLFSGACGLASGLLPKGRAPDATGVPEADRISPEGIRLLVSFALFTFGSLLIWPFIERAADAIGMSAVAFGQAASISSVISFFGSLALAAWVTRMRPPVPLTIAVLTCGTTCSLLTTTNLPVVFGASIAIFSCGFFAAYSLFLGIGFAVEPSGRLPVLCTSVWLAMTSLGSVVTGGLVELLGSYTLIGPAGMLFCIASLVHLWPLFGRVAPARRNLRAEPLTS